MKKKSRKPVLPSTHGKAYQYLMQNFCPVPDGDPLKNGHVMLIYAENLYSITKTISAVREKIKSRCIILPHQIKSVTDILCKYRHQTRDNDMKIFAEKCNETFNKFCLIPECADETQMEVDKWSSAVEIPQPEAGPSLNVPLSEQVQRDFEHVPGSPTDYRHPSPWEHPQPETTPVKQFTPGPFMPSTPGSSVRRSREVVTPRKKELKKRILFECKTKMNLKKRFMETTKSLRSQLKSARSIKIKYLNQDKSRLKRIIAKKEARITQLETENRAGIELEKTKLQLKELNRSHRRLLQANKGKRATAASVTVSVEEHADLLNIIKIKDGEIAALQNEKLILEETIQDLQKSQGDVKRSKKDRKTYSLDTRMTVYTSVINQVPTQNIPDVIAQFSEYSGERIDYVPHRTTVEQMTRELGIISDLQTAELCVKTCNLTLGFDATTQEGVHINSIHLTTKTDCHVIAVDQLAGGTAEDYHSHVCNSIDQLASVYSDFHDEDYQHSRQTMIDNIANTMTDRVAVNHASIAKVNESWGKTLNELNCHLHPLDTIASTCRSSLKSLETSKGKLYGNDCLAGNIVLQMNKFRYKDGKGDPKGFTTFLDDKKLPRGLLPRYRGNRLHILFHICGKFILYYDEFIQFLTTGTVTCGGLQAGILADFKNPTAVLEMQVLGLLGKLLSGPWMRKFYTSATDQIEHIEGITVMKDVLASLKECRVNPLNILQRTTDFFGNTLDEKDETLTKLISELSDKAVYSEMTATCLGSVISVIERQYKRYFEMDLTAQLKKETQSARSHNIDAEEIMGMFSAAKHRAPNATLCFLSSRMRAKKNRVLQYLNSMYRQKRERVVSWAVGRARQKRQANRKRHLELRKELSKRAALKRQKIDDKTRKDIEKKLRTLDPDDVVNEFPELENSSDLVGILNGTVIGRDICHVWYDSDTLDKIIYYGRIEKLKRKRGNIYEIAYWKEDESYNEDAVDYSISKFELGADLICEDVVFS